MSRNATWTNPDGLTKGFGTHEIDDNVPRVVAGPGNVKTAQVTIKWSDLAPFGTVTAAFQDRPQGIVLRQGTRIVSGSFIPNVAFVGATAVLNVGTYAYTGTGALGTVDDLDSIVTACAVTEINAIGKTHVCDGAAIGLAVLVGAIVESDCVIVAQTATADFTAGEGIFTISYYEPTFPAGTVITGDSPVFT